MNKLKPELLMPAGSLEKLKAALDFGADAVYAGVPIFSLRARENEFSYESLEEGIRLTKDKNKQLYLTVNIFARNAKINAFTKALDKIASLKPDALIMSDPGLIDIVKEKLDVPIHLSVQSNCMNWRSVKFWQAQGISRIILSRELRLTEIQEIKQRVPDIELEAFVHGSICIAYSGRCLLSQYMSHRDANQGVCDNSCRYPYRLYKESEIAQHDFYLQDLRDPAEFYPIEEDEHGTYIMNSKDLCLIEHLKEIVDAGVISLKVEGRTKSDFYTAMVARNYRRAIDDMIAGKPFDQGLVTDLNKLSPRGYHKGFLLGSPGKDAQNYESKTHRQHNYIGVVQNSGDNETTLEVKGQIRIGQEVRVITPSEEATATVEALFDGNGNQKEILHPGTGLGRVRLSKIINEQAYLVQA